MSSAALKGIGIVCLVACLILVFVAIERYQDNAKKVEAMNQMGRQSPFGGMVGGGKFEPATPTATKYALVFAVITGIGGIVCLVIGANKGGADASSQGAPVPASPQAPDATATAAASPPSQPESEQQASAGSDG